MSTVFSARLRLVPVGRDGANDLWLVHQDDDIAEWYAGRWSRTEAADKAATMEREWRTAGVHKWLAYRRDDGQLVGRGGLSYAQLDGRRRLELGWAIRAPYQGQGYATEIGRAGLAYAFDELAAPEVLAFTERHNTRSRAVMRRLGMAYTGEIELPGLLPGRTGVHADAPFALYRARRPEPPVVPMV